MASDDLSGSAVALLCAIGEFNIDHASERQKTHLYDLIVGGYVADNDAAGRYRLTAKGVEFLTQRGVGLNES